MNAENDARDLNNRYQMLTAANNRINIQIKQNDIYLRKSLDFTDKETAYGRIDGRKKAHHRGEQMFGVL